MKFIRTNELLDYDQAMFRMHQIVDEIILGNSEDTVWFLEHLPIYTVGYTTYEDFLLKYGSTINGIPIIKSERGGKITFHGPGQRICYLMLNIKRLYEKIDLYRFLNAIHDAIIRSLKKFNIDGAQDPKYPGVWVAKNKIAAIGMKIKKGVSYHGLAININNDLNPFKLIQPCGILEPDRGVISIKKILKKFVKINEFDDILQYELEKLFSSKINVSKNQKN
jgi:lipoyl(octanoyl) transferase